MDKPKREFKLPVTKGMVKKDNRIKFKTTNRIAKMRRKQNKVIVLYIIRNDI